MNNTSVKSVCKFLYGHIFNSFGYVPGSVIARLKLDDFKELDESEQIEIVLEVGNHATQRKLKHLFFFLKQG